jgi:hypothetical protein
LALTFNSLLSETARIDSEYTGNRLLASPPYGARSALLTRH